jgi:hypothetical protein
MTMADAKYLPTQLTVNTDTATIAGVPLTVDPTVINSLSGLTATAAELNTLDGITASTAELNLLDGAGAVVASGTTAAVIADISEVAAEMSVAERQAFNAVLAALRAFGIIAT